MACSFGGSSSSKCAYNDVLKDYVGVYLDNSIKGNPDAPQCSIDSLLKKPLITAPCLLGGCDGCTYFQRQAELMMERIDKECSKNSSCVACANMFKTLKEFE